MPSRTTAAGMHVTAVLVAPLDASTPFSPVEAAALQE